LVIPPRVVTLLSDFGHRDAFVGSMKGVILARCPTAQVVDLTHEIEPGDIVGAALQLRYAAQYFPAGTIHLAVVDPGVGSERRPVAVRSGGHFFIGPDNGMLWPAVAGAGSAEPFELRDARYRLPDVSATFHGRDIFAPAAGHLAAGVPIESIGPRCSELHTLALPEPTVKEDRIEGEVLWVDRFGNAITNLSPSLVHGLAGGGFRLVAGTTRIEGPSSHYAAVPIGRPLVVLGSMGLYEIAVHRGNAAEMMGLCRGSPVAVRALP
jgi:S-adenosylmethionine hydrolase